MNKDMKQLWLTTFETSFGQFKIGSTTKGLALVMLPSEDSMLSQELIKRKFPDYKIEQDDKINEKAKSEIIEYLNGNRKQFDLPLDLICTEFQEKALDEVARIPYGQTKTYGEIAHILGKPGASRAVGTANARNPIPIIIPCHRVLASNGLGGYAGGLLFKRKLLALEGALTLDMIESK